MPEPILPSLSGLGPLTTAKSVSLDLCEEGETSRKGG